MGILYFTAILINIPHLGCFGLFWRGEGNSVTRDYTPHTSMFNPRKTCDEAPG